MSFVLIAHLRAKPGNEEVIASVLRELAAASKDEPGCELYIPSRDAGDPGSFFIYEQYRDEAALEEHRRSTHFERLAVGELFPLIEPSKRAVYDTL
jgi:quinol monooxygenase YgiN